MCSALVLLGGKSQESKSRQVSCTVLTITLSVPLTSRFHPSSPFSFGCGFPRANIHAPNWRPLRGPPFRRWPPLCPRCG